MAGALACAALGGPSFAQTGDGTEYTGSHAAGGILHLTLSSAGDSIVGFDVDGIAGGGCSWDVIDLSNWGGPIAVMDGHFEATNGDGDTIAGQFTPPAHAEGTIQVHDPIQGCETPPLRWVADASPP